MPTPVYKPIGVFERYAAWVSHASGSAPAFTIAFLAVLVWLLTGPLFGYSEKWQLVINTGTTIVTFLMVFLLQHSQWKDTVSMQVKLNELIAAAEGASNRLIDIEDLSEKEIEILEERFRKLARSSPRVRGPTTIEDV